MRSTYEWSVRTVYETADGGRGGYWDVKLLPSLGAAVRAAAAPLREWERERHPDVVGLARTVELRRCSDAGVLYWPVGGVVTSDTPAGRVAVLVVECPHGPFLVDSAGCECARVPERYVEAVVMMDGVAVRVLA